MAVCDGFQFTCILYAKKYARARQRDLLIEQRELNATREVDGDMALEEEIIVAYQRVCDGVFCV